MSYFLTLIIILLGVGGYFEYTIIQDKEATNNKKITELTSKVDELQDENKKLTEERKSLDDTIASLKSGKPPVGTPAAVPHALSNILGTIATTTGKTYQNCRLMKVETDGIVISHTEGIMKLSFGVISPDLQKRFGYDLKVSTSLSPEQVQADEQQRLAAGD